MSIPIKEVTKKTINRFPMLYKLQAQKAIEVAIGLRNKLHGLGIEYKEVIGDEQRD